MSSEQATNPNRVSDFANSRNPEQAPVELSSLYVHALLAGENPADKKRFSVPWFVLGTTIIVIGVVSLLASLNYLPDINWAWVLTLTALGGVSLMGGLNKVSFVVAGTFFASSVGSVLRQTGMVKLNVEVPLLIIFAGVLVLVGMVLKLRSPAMLSSVRVPR